MLNKYARELFTRIFTPVARALLRLGVSADAVTIGGTVAISAGALVLYPLGQLFWGTLFITLFIFSDIVDGIMARLQGQSSQWGNFLDSTMDRIQDGVIFAGVAIWFFTGGNNPVIGYAALASLVCGQVVSYARAKAESLGLNANVGIAERAERILVVLLLTGLTGLGLHPAFLTVGLILLALASLFTIYQRVRAVYQQTH